MACEHCGVDKDAIKAEIQRGADARIKELTDRSKALTEQLREAVTRATTAEAAAATYTAREQELALKEAEASAGWALDERGRKAAKWAYEDAVGETAEAERPTFSDWLKSEAATGDVLLASWRKPAQTTTTTTQTAPPGTRPPPTPPRNANEAPPGAKLTPEQIKAKAREITSGPGTMAEKLAKLSALDAETRQGVTPAA